MKSLRRFCLVSCAIAFTHASRAAAQPSLAGQPMSPMGRAALEHPKPGDHLFLQILGDTSIVETVMVDHRGNVPLPMLGVVNVSGIAIGDVPDSIRARYAKYLRNPAIEVRVDRRVTVDGEVTKPDVYYIDLATTLRDLIAQAGGLTPSANARKVAIVHDGKRTPVPDWQTNDSTALALRSGDEVVVGRRNWLELNALGALSAAALLVSVVFSLRKL